MTMNKSGSSGGTLGNSSSPCGHNMTSWEERMDQLYTYFYILIFVPGLLLNTIALWVLCRHISKKTKAVIFMINLALADLAHVLSLPLRIYYYFTHTWPFGNIVCLFCFYLKYLNMYASIVFLVCISLQRCVFLLNPFFARRWRRRYDLLISVVVWLVVGLGCSPFILGPIAFTKLYASPFTTPSPPKSGCFKDLPTRQLPLFLAITIMTLGELFGFVLPLVGISYSSIRIARSLNQRQSTEPQKKRRALRMVLSCFALFLLCFAPYHLNFLLYLMVSQDIVSHCATRLAVRQFHPVSLCLASMSCCLNPLLYYFLTAEFRSHLTRRTSSFTSSLMSMESFSSYRE
uniref:P2Y receptor family member 10 n=1 Tax=Myripristis murdjan TaxID=586833 RepID=A0A667ZG09_9TELE